MSLSDSILLAMALLAISIIAAGLFRKFSIPYSVLLVLIGLGLSELAAVWQPLHGLHTFALSPDLVFFIFLPALIFESGLSLDARRLMKDLMPVLTLAVPALLISTALIGTGLWLAIDMPLTVTLLFGALISATDPVAVVALFRELGAPARLNVLVEGESLFNDATAIVIFGILLSMTLHGDSADLAAVGSAILEFLRVFIGGAVAGIIIGLTISELLYRLRSALSAILAMSIVTAYSSFIIAEHYLHVSGVMATVTASLSLSIYGLTRMPGQVKPSLTETWELIGLIANSLLFLLVGLSIDLQDLYRHGGLILIAVILVQAARAVSVYAMTPATTLLFRLPRISMAERHIMWWGGLKGGLAIAIVLSIPQSMPGRELLVSLTLGVVLFTLLVNAWSIRPIMNRLGLNRLSADEESELEFARQHASQQAYELTEHYRHLGLLSDKVVDDVHGITTHVLKPGQSTQSMQRQQRKVAVAAWHIEMETIEQLYRQGLISQYILMDLRNLLQQDQDKGGSELSPNLFLRLEMRVLRSLREKNWAARLLARFQRQRLQQHIQRDIAGILMARNVMDTLAQRQDLDQAARNELIETYQQRYQRRKQRLTALRSEFPDTVEHIETLLFQRAALSTALATADHDLHNGEIGVKAYNRVRETIGEKLESLGHETSASRYNLSQIIASLPLFSALSPDSLAQLAGHAQSVNFLAGDIIIGEHEKGDALYVIVQGKAEVSSSATGSTQKLADIAEGDFFGEMALLGQHVRTATVTARTPMTLLRLTRQQVLALADENEEISRRLEQARSERSPQTG
jgi:CPA1 family monovalent cation:H+ antiporter